jgi:hypothetical protein
VDVKYELPVAFSVTKASRSEVKEGQILVDEMKPKAPITIDRCAYFIGDKGYDDTRLITKLWGDHEAHNRHPERMERRGGNEVSKW